MGKIINGQGEYKSKKTGENVAYEFEYASFSNLEEMISEVGEDKVFKNAQRMFKVDASNVAREGAKVANGDSTRKALTEEEKAEAKVNRATDKALLAKLKTLSPAQREALGL